MDPIKDTKENIKKHITTQGGQGQGSEEYIITSTTSSTHLVLAHLSNNVIVFFICISCHKVVSRSRPTVGVHVTRLRFCEVRGREALNRIADVLLRENRQGQKQEDEQRVLSIQLVHAIINGNVDPPDQVVKSGQERSTEDINCSISNYPRSRVTVSH